MEARTNQPYRPFTRLLIANRGEIAIRIVGTARRMGLTTIAVYSDVDRDALHTSEADQAEHIGGSAPSESYLSIPNIMAAAKRSGAQAIHPGYGFLAENPAFARACQEAGLVFVGPSPEAIAAMGDKAVAKSFMAKVGVPVIPGQNGQDQSDKTLAAVAKRIGYPVMIKAVAGGGGRGMRLVEKAEDFASLLANAKSEARNAFGDDRVLIEKAIVDPRHVEIQVFGDAHGKVVHLGERDCSVQRRHQKLIEEAPSTAVSTELRDKMGALAVKAAKKLGYVGAGTLEFLLAPNGDFYFMEMNTRLQVEHRVTEQIFGLDLVAWQISVAMGEPLPMKQGDLIAKGHSIEVRLCAEAPANGFTPRSGRCAAFWLGHQAYDSGVRAGSEVSPFYDSMIAKLFVWGPDREAARLKLARVLETSTVLGIETNQDFLARTLRHPLFVSGAATTGFLAAHQHELVAPVGNDPPPDEVLAALAIYRKAITRMPSARHLGPPMPRPMVLGLAGKRVTVKVHRERNGAFDATIDDTVLRFQRVDFEHGFGDAENFTLESGGTVIRTPIAFTDGAVHLQRGSRAIRVDDLTFASTASPKTGGDGVARATMNGRVVDVHVAPGASVKAGDPLVTLEAMKMQHVHTSAIDGRVGEVLAHPGDQVATGRVLVRVQPSAPS